MGGKHLGGWWWDEACVIKTFPSVGEREFSLRAVEVFLSRFQHTFRRPVLFRPFHITIRTGARCILMQ